MKRLSDRALGPRGMWGQLTCHLACHLTCRFFFPHVRLPLTFQLPLLISRHVDASNGQRLVSLTLPSFQIGAGFTVPSSSPLSSQTSFEPSLRASTFLQIPTFKTLAITQRYGFSSFPVYLGYFHRLHSSPSSLCIHLLCFPLLNPH